MFDRFSDTVAALRDGASHLFTISSDYLRDGAQEADKLWNRVSLRFLNLIVDTPAEYWFLHPIAQLATLCLSLMVVSVAMAFSMGLLQDIKQAWAWFRGRKTNTSRSPSGMKQKYPSDKNRMPVYRIAADSVGEEIYKSVLAEGIEKDPEDYWDPVRQRYVYKAKVLPRTDFCKPLQAEHLLYAGSDNNNDNDERKAATNRLYLNKKSIQQKVVLSDGDATMLRAKYSPICKSRIEQAYDEGEAWDNEERVFNRKEHLTRQ